MYMNFCELTFKRDLSAGPDGPGNPDDPEFILERILLSFQFHYLRSQLKKSKVQIILVEAVNTEIRFNRFKPV